MDWMRDMIFVRSLEKQLGRSLTEDELCGDEFKVVFPDGHAMWVQIPVLQFPYDLINRSEEIDFSFELYLEVA